MYNTSISFVLKTIANIDIKVRMQFIVSLENKDLWKAKF